MVYGLGFRVLLVLCGVEGGEGKLKGLLWAS